MEKITLFDTEVKDYAQMMKAKWIMNGGIDKEWNEYIATLKKMGLPEMIAIKQKALERFNNTK